MSGQSRWPRAIDAMSASVKLSRCARIRLLMPPHTASSTHWPSWSQAPSWWGSAEVADGDRAVDGGHDLAQGDLAGLAGQHVAAAHAALRAHDAGALEGEEDLLQVRLRQAGALGDVAHRGRPGLVGVQREREQRPAGVVASGRHLHAVRLYGPTYASGRAADARLLPCPTDTPRSRPTTAPASRNVVPALLRAGRRRAGVAPRRPPTTPSGSSSWWSTGWAGTSSGPGQRLTPALGGLDGGPITTVAPSTTATALTSITTGLPPGEHGVVGLPHRRRTARCSTSCAGTPRPATPAQSIPPSKVQTHACFGGQRPPAVTRAEFATSGFTGAHLDGARFTRIPHAGDAGGRDRAPGPGRRAVRLRLLRGPRQGVARVRPRRPRTTRSCVWIDHLVARLLEQLPTGTVLVVTADHGQVEVGDNVIALPADVLAHVQLQSGEGRFRWLHARSGRADALLDAADRAPRRRTPGCAAAPTAIAEGWYGPVVTDAAAGRLGDVLLAAKGDGRLRRSRRHRPLRPGRPPRLAHRGRDARPPAGRRRLDSGAR